MVSSTKKKQELSKDIANPLGKLLLPQLLFPLIHPQKCIIMILQFLHMRPLQQHLQYFID